MKTSIVQLSIKKKDKKDQISQEEDELTNKRIVNDFLKCLVVVLNVSIIEHASSQLKFS